jgi:glycosyltransferase involved in cell wall biosynthesis
MSELYAIADVLLVHLRPDALTDVSIPSKTFAYMASGKPVVMAVRGEAAKFVERNGFGVAVEPSDPIKLAEAVRWMKSLPTEELQKIGNAGLEAYRTKYCSDLQVERFEHLLREVTEKR